MKMPTATQSIHEIVAAEPSAVAVFERFGIDVCSYADGRLDRVCAELQLSVDQVLEKLADAESQARGVTAPDLERYSLTRLIQHIVRTHHRSVRQELPHFAEVSHRIASEQGEQAPQFKSVAELIEQLSVEMFSHFEKEEQILFPCIVHLEEAVEDRSQRSSVGLPSVAQPVGMMMREHDTAEGIVSELRRLTNGFEPPAWACPRNTALHTSLAVFEANLRQHVHLENNLLFPRALALEANLAQRRQL